MSAGDERRAIPEPPVMMRALPRDERGYVYPWFVDRNPATGELDHRVASPHKRVRAVKERLCWVCGLPLGTKRMTFVIGPMCLVNRTTSEPGCHHACATYSVKVCPWMSSPKRKRRPLEDTIEWTAPAGEGILRNPGACVLYVTRNWEVQRVPVNNRGVQPGWLIRLGDPERLEFWAEGRPATREELCASIDSGLPLLEKVAREESKAAEDNLRKEIDRTYAELERFASAFAGG